MTNCCAFDCSYCVNRKSNDIPRATFTPRELAELTVEFYRRNYIEGLFLSSAVLGTPDYTTERMLPARARGGATPPWGGPPPTGHPRHKPGTVAAAGISGRPRQVSRA